MKKPASPVPVKKKPLGPPGKYSDTMGLAIARLMEKTGALALAAEAMGVNRYTAYDWNKLGKEGDPKYVQFAAMIEKAKAKYCVTLIKQIKKPEWVLSRLEPELFPYEPASTVVNVQQTQVISRDEALKELKELAETDPEVARLIKANG